MSWLDHPQTEPVFRISQSNRTVLFDPSDTYIWDLLMDKEGNFFVATGHDGKIYRISPNGETELFYEGPARHILSLAIDENGDILAGTGNPGQIIRVNKNRESFVLFDSYFQEIRSLLIDETNNTIYAAALSDSSSKPSKQTGVSQSTTNPSVARPSPTSTTISLGSTASTSLEKHDNLKGAVYRVQHDGAWDRVWGSSHETPYDINQDTNGNILVSTGPEGRLLDISQDPPQTTLLLRAPAEQITSLTRTESDVLFYTTANPARAYVLDTVLADSGLYTSPVMDAGSLSAWGAMRWNDSRQPNDAIRFFTRSGNTDNPVENWSPWTSPSFVNGPQINSPNARYLQWKVELRNKDLNPELLSVSLSYLAKNLRPEITKLTVHGPGVVFQSSFPSNDPPIAGLDTQAFSGSSSKNGSGGNTQSTPSLGRRIYRKGLQTIDWTARDPNNDNLAYDLFYKKDTASVWLPLRETLTTNLFTWDTSSTPDGSYLIRLIATDKPSNKEGASLSDLKESTLFLIDNTQPSIEFVETESTASVATISFLVKDEQSPIKHVEYSVDSSDWKTLYPEDGISDSEIETFQFSVARISLSDVVIRAKDSMDNIVTKSLPM